MTRDLDATQHFYGSVLGWSFRPGSLGPEFSVAMLDGAPVAGLGALAHRLGQPVSWTPYFYVDSADLAASRLQERGGTLAVGPLKFGPGRAVLAADLTGAVFGLWEGAETPGWKIGRASAPAWLELHTADPFTAAVFYGGLLGWASGEPGACDVSYENDEILVRSESSIVAGLRGPRPGDVPGAGDVGQPFWQVYFRVSDTDAIAGSATGAGGRVIAPPDDTWLGRVAELQDPFGARFTVVADIP
ncbi:VOC family protein [Streptomyces sp. ACA25]|uniref:VOC family protein n=1 Tax=Streptomyces sp. ACA25 TaxID=3022596 RepID=UPI002307B0DA|nr:VOC family protein [Streptomyces sp. ACA25]MDB1090069.1 VOC family protein [Streptomyces sp. ACA25]